MGRLSGAALRPCRLAGHLACLLDCVSLLKQSPGSCKLAALSLCCQHLLGSALREGAGTPLASVGAAPSTGLSAPGLGVPVLGLSRCLNFCRPATDLLGERTVQGLKQIHQQVRAAG